LNSYRQNDNGKEKSQSVFTKETLGVVLILFATLLMVCLITRESIFSLPGQYINAFLIGCFGYFSFVLTAFVAFMGILLVAEKKTGLSLKRKFYIVAFFVLCAVLIHAITTSGVEASFGDYLALSYTMGEGGIATCSGGGFFTALLVYPLLSILSEIGLYVVVSILIVLCGYGLIHDIVNNKGIKHAKPAAEKFRSSFVAEDPNLPAVEGLEVKEYPVSGVDFSDGDAKPKQKLFINNAQSFEFKTKRELKNPQANQSVTLLNSGSGINVAGSKTYSETYKNDMKERLDYIKTPAKIDVDKIVKNTSQSSYGYTNTNYTSTTISNPIPSRPVQSVSEPSVKPESNVEEPPVVIPLFEHDDSNKESDTAVSRARRFSENYIELPDVEPTQTTNAKVESETERFIPLRDEVMPTRTEPPVSTPVEMDVPFVDESEDDTAIEVMDEAVIEDVAEEVEPPVSRLNNERTRGILFSNDDKDEDETVGYTSRVEADKNTRRLGLFGGQTEKEEPVKEEPVKEREPVPINRMYIRPPFNLLEQRTATVDQNSENHQERMEIIKQTLEDFHISAMPQSYVQGPSFTRYEVMMPAGVSVKKVLGYDDDLKMRLSAKSGIRIEAPIPGKNLVGIEVANNVKTMVGFRSVMEGLAEQESKKGALIFAIGKDIVGRCISYDLAKGPHYLIAGATGSGKSVCLHVMIVSLLMRYSPEELQIVLIDPKSVEFCRYEHIPHLLVDEIITDSKRAITLLQWAYDETNRRNEMFRNYEAVSNIDDYNSTVASDTVPKLPRIVFFIDELADLMESCKKDLEEKIRKIAAKSRSAGIHLVLATQRPSVDVVTGTIKANLPSRIALRVMNFADSQTILSGGGAEKLLGNGDMLYKDSTMGDYERYQGAYISNREIANVVNFIKENNKAYFNEDVKEYLDKESNPRSEESAVSYSGGVGETGDAFESNDLLVKALALAVCTGSISISQLQRRFQIGYAKAGGLVDKMERNGYVSANEGAKARRVLMTREEFEQKYGTAPENF